MGVPESVTYSTVVLRDSLIIFLMTDAINDLDVLGDDIQNELLTEPNGDKSWLRVRLEFGPDKSKYFIFVRTLYSLVLASAYLGPYTEKKLNEMVFKSLQSNTNVWMRLAKRPYGE